MVQPKLSISRVHICVSMGKYWRSSGQVALIVNLDELYFQNRREVSTYIKGSSTAHLPRLSLKFKPAWMLNIFLGKECLFLADFLNCKKLIFMRLTGSYRALLIQVNSNTQIDAFKSLIFTQLNSSDLCPRQQKRCNDMNLESLVNKSLK